MTEPDLGVKTVRSALVPDDVYPAVALAALHLARRRCLVSMFIYEVAGLGQPALMNLRDALSEAHWRGADTRVVLGGSRENFNIGAAAAGARAVLLDSGVPTRWLSAKPTRRGSHAKLVIADNLVLIGSHNWSLGAFDGSQIQDTVALDSAAFAGGLQMRVFEAQWRGAGLVT